jgi:hypothetical protein
MTDYKHTQIGYLIVVTLFSLIIFFGVILSLQGYNLVLIMFMIFILFILGSFSTLTVSVDNQYLKIKFGYGIFKKQFNLMEMVSVKRVRNHWYYGWGIRYWPGMLIFNVSGFDAIEIKMVNGKIYRIGTDEPKKLETSISQYSHTSL